jgi:hypothetical protein
MAVGPALISAGGEIQYRAGTLRTGARMVTTPSRRSSRLILMLGAVGGLAAGYASVALGATGVVLALVILGLAAAGTPRSRLLFPFALLGAGVGGLLTLSPVLFTASLCKSNSGGGSSSSSYEMNCYLPLTLWAAVVYGALAFVGLVAVALVTMRSRR